MSTDGELQRAVALLSEAEKHIDEEESNFAESKAEEAIALFRSSTAGGSGPGKADAVRVLALSRSCRGDRKAALNLITAELATVRSGGDRRAEAVLLLAHAEIANSRCGSKRREEGYQSVLQAIEMFRELKERRWEGWALIALAHTHVQRGTKSEIPEELTRAVQAASQAQTILREVGDKVGEGKALHTIAVSLSFQNNVDEAVARSRELVSHWRDLGYSRLEAFQNECVSEWELLRHRPEEALQAAQAAQLKRESEQASAGNEADVKSQIPGRSAAALIHASNAYLTMGKTDEALKLSEEKLEHFQKNGDFESEVVAQSARVSAYMNDGRLEEAIGTSLETLQRLRSKPTTRLLKCWETDMLQSLARIYLRAQDIERAQQTIDEAMKLAEAEKDRKALAATWLLQSDLSLLKHENRMGLKAAMKSRDLCRKVGTKKGEASALLQLCSAYCSRGELKRGAAVTVESQRIFASVGDREGEADALRMQAEVRSHLNDFPRAIAASRRCRELQREIGCRRSEAWACIQLAQTLLSAASEEEQQEMDRRKKEKEEKAKQEGKEPASQGNQDWFQTDEEDDNQEPPARAAFDRALQASKDAVQLSRPLEDEQQLGRALLSLATAHLTCLEADSATKAIEEGIPLAQKAADKSAEAHFILVKAQLAEYHGPKHHHEAKDYANKALQLFTAQKDESGEKAAKTLLKRLTPKTIGSRPTNTGGGRYYSAEDDDDEMEEYWEEEVIEEGGGGTGQAEAYKGPSVDEVSATVTDVALSLIGVESLDADEPLMDAGLDSLAAVEFGNTIAKEFVGVNLPSTLMFDFPSVKLLSQYIDTNMREVHEQSEALKLQNSTGGQRKTRMVKKFRPRPGGGKKRMMAAPGPQMGFAPSPAPLNLQPEPYKGPSIDDVSSTVTDVALSLIGVESLDADEPLMDAGLDSLAAVEFGNTIAKEFVGVNLPSTLMFDFPSVKLLSQFIDTNMREVHEQKEAERMQQAQQAHQQQQANFMNRQPALRDESWNDDRRGGSSGFGGYGASQQQVQQVQQSAPAPAPGAVKQYQPYSGPTTTEIAEVVKDTALSLIGVESLDDDEALMDAGLDSLAAVEFGSAIAKDFVGLEMPTTLMFDFPSVKTLTQFIDSGLREAHEQSQQ